MAVELVGGAILSAFLQVAFQKLASAEIGDYFRGRKLNEKLLKRLNITLHSINAVVDDAELKQIKNPNVRAWLDAVKDAVFDAEDLLEEIDIELSRCKLKAKSQSKTTTRKVRNFFNASSRSFDKDIESKMQEVLDNLEYLASKKDILDLKETTSGFGVGSSNQVSKKLPSTSLPIDNVIYGRDVDKKIIFDWLTSDDENRNHKLSIISIVGMGGMGKTTLAQHLYNDPKMEGKFDVKAWVSVSQEFDVFEVTRAILEGITGSTNDSRNLDMLQVKLKEKLSGTRFLLVLDDVWNEKRDQWEALHTPLNYGAKGSKILVTTRSKKVSSIMRSNKMLQLEQLEEEHCWKLFVKHAFQDENPPINHDFMDISKRILPKCQGLPLALKTIGSLLYKKSSLVEWESILASEIWDLPEEESNVIPALMLSYHHLPSHLKRCFSYCALFPKNYVFEKEELILLWMAENFLQCPQQSMRMEAVGEQYFNDLFSRSFFQQSRENEMHFIMHDLLNDLAKYVCGDFCFTFRDEESNHILKMTRHLSFLVNQINLPKPFKTLHNANRLRTFLSLSMQPSDLNPSKYKMSTSFMQELFSKFKFFRVLSLPWYSIENELPDNIGNLKHLRYLDLSSNLISKVPDSVCCLYNLEILKLRDCWFLKELPLNLHKLTKLRYLDFSGTGVRKMPMDMERLKNLQVLSSFYVNKGSEANIQQLGELNLHGTLSIFMLQNVGNPFDAHAANLKSKVHLVKLELEWNAKSDNPEKEREVLEKLQPSKHLKELSILSYGGTRLPDWFGDNSLSNVVSLKLSNCENCVLLPSLGILSSLKELCITGLSGIVVIGSEFYGKGSSSSSAIIPFASLKTLIFDNMKGWKEWECKILTGAFPCLQELSIKNCPNLKECLPEQLPRLMKLEISYCKQLVSSVSLAPTIHELHLINCGKLKFDSHPTTLKILKISGYCMQELLLEWIEHTLSHTSLESLEIKDCPTLNIPLGCCYNFLISLKITSSCDSLRTFSLDFFPKLKSIELQKCSNLEMITQEHGYNLTCLLISECPNFVSFPIGRFSAPFLRVFEIIDLENLKSLPDCMHTLFPHLTSLNIKNCRQLESFSDGGLPSSLKLLCLERCSELLIASLKWALGINTSLENLNLYNVDMESFPDQGLLPLSLISLHVSNCPNLKILDYKGLCHLSSLKELHLYNCPSLQCLPVEGLPKSISTLEIFGCPSLKLNGEDWWKISHIESVFKLPF